MSWRCTPLVHLQRGRSSCISRHHSGTRWRSSCPCSPLSKRPEDALEGSLYEPSGRELKCDKESQLARMCVCTFKQAARFAPEEMPTSRPSSLASLLAFAMASSVVTVTVSSMTEVSRTSGINPGPTPWILCLPGAPPEEYQCLSMCRYNFRDCDSYSKYCILLSHCSRVKAFKILFWINCCFYICVILPEITGLSAGSTQMILTPGFCIFRYFPTPETVPPVPEPATNMSTLPAVSF